MNWIIAERNTLLRRWPAQSSSLSDDEKHRAEGGGCPDWEEKQVLHEFSATFEETFVSES